MSRKQLDAALIWLAAGIVVCTVWGLAVYGAIALWQGA